MNFLTKFAFWRKFSRHLLVGISAMVLLAFFQTGPIPLFADDEGSCSGSHLGRNRTTQECRRFEDMCMPYNWLVDNSCPQNSPPFSSTGSPTCSINVSPSSGPTGTFFNFYANTTGSIRDYQWELDGDNDYNDASGPSTSRNYSNSTTVYLRIIDSGGNSGTCSAAVNVTTGSTGDAPTCSISPQNPSSAASPYTVNFSGNATAPSGRYITTYHWDFNGDGSFDSSSQNPSWTFYNSSQVRLHVIDNTGKDCNNYTYVTVGAIQPGQCSNLPNQEFSCQGQQYCTVNLTRDASCNIISRNQPYCNYVQGQCGYNPGGGTFQGCRRDDYGPNDWVHKEQWCSCAASFNDTGSLMRGPAYNGSLGACSQAPKNIENPSFPANRCDDLARNNQVCGQRAYGNCTPLCNGTRAYYHCVAWENNMCQGDIYCNSEDSRCGGGIGGDIPVAPQISCPAGGICMVNFSENNNTNTTGDNINTNTIGDIINTITNTNTSSSYATGGAAGSATVNITW